MKLFLAVLFFCQNGQCYFWKSSELFFKLEECQKVLKQASQELFAQGSHNEGTCLPINTSNQIKW